MNKNKEKIEFWLHSNQKSALKSISEETGYSVSELMRRGVEYIIKELMLDYLDQRPSKVPFKGDSLNVKD
jgi:hypothetical protein